MMLRNINCLAKMPYRTRHIHLTRHKMALSAALDNLIRSIEAFSKELDENTHTIALTRRGRPKVDLHFRRIVTQLQCSNIVSAASKRTAINNLQLAPASRSISTNTSSLSGVTNTKEEANVQNDSVSNSEEITPKEIYYNETDITDDIVKLYAHKTFPKVVLHNMYDLVSNEFKRRNYKVTPTYRSIKSKNSSAWLCCYHIYWPVETKFVAKDTTKAKASNKAALAALAWLKKNNKISSQGSPMIYDEEEVKVATKKVLPKLTLDDETIGDMQKIVNIHQSKMIEHIMDGREMGENDVKVEEGEDGPLAEAGEVSFRGVKEMRYLGLDQYKTKEKVKLPIAKYKEDFIDLLKSNQVIIVKGEPGCGKSTRVPQYVLEAWATDEGLSGNPGRIAVTQPRRIAAISLAERVASERDERVGSIVGYQVRLNSKFEPTTGRILYCTTGILLRHFQSDPNLTNFTHVILDEAHERDVNTDLLMNLLRGAVQKNPKLKVVVMSATIDTSMFSKYFGGAPVIDIPGFTYPVKQHFMDDCKLEVHKTIDMCEDKSPNLVHEDVVKVIKYICDKKPEGAILCFLPGWEDITKVYKMIPERNDLVTYCLHSRLQDSEQWKIFSRPPPGVRKIILATNIAETSVTVDDVVYVVDSGIHKEQRFDVEKGVNCIDNYWISKASAIQRKGRAGRVQPGESYHMYTKEKYKEFEDYSMPEIMRTSLTKIVLDSKVCSNNMNALEFMVKLPTPPEENATLRAVEDLKDLELLDENENLTSLGKTLAEFQLEPSFSKAMVNAVIFKCVTPVVDIVTLFSSETELFSSGLMNKENIKATKSDFCSSSDHLAMMRIFEKFLEFSDANNETGLRMFCKRLNLVPHRMKTIEKLRKIHFDYLFNGLYDVMPIADDYSDNDELVKAVILSGIGNILQHRNWDIVKNRLKQNVNVLLTRNNHKATITQESVNYKRNCFPSEFLLYLNETRSNVRRMTLVRECSLVSQLSVLLFSNKNLNIEKVDDDIKSDISSDDPVKLVLENTTVKLICDRKEAEELIRCKVALMSCYRYYTRQLTNPPEYNKSVNAAWDEILVILNKILKRHQVD
ncbi:unnamed protein product [Acanthoscelides obtectus]|uniref:RNA helicase n=2 Tax=Acanthoscelides obtectus TaxID=200917 RepID=A0A9P0Q0T9_ACAOB|nr:unnamed protein product [Acanthoscelides obtectus]CAK1657489.1 Putative ATP-dependent RNA helicase DHX30 [Acanthoscelides obtectus]